MGDEKKVEITKSDKGKIEILKEDRGSKDHGHGQGRGEATRMTAPDAWPPPPPPKKKGE